MLFQSLKFYPQCNRMQAYTVRAPSHFHDFMGEDLNNLDNLHG